MIIKVIYAVVHVSLLMGLQSVNGCGFSSTFISHWTLKSNYNKIENKVQQRAVVDYFNIYVFYYL
jgi:hypothetical protein